MTWTAVDEDGDFGAGTNLRDTVIDVAGLYVMTASWGRPVTAPAASIRISIFLNGAAIAGAYTDSSTGTRRASCAATRQLAVGDLVQAEAQTGNLTNPTLSECHLALTRIGPVRWT